MKSGVLNNKPFLYLTEFFAGMSVMAVELGASRLLAPYFSSSQIVWTIIIGTIMIAMALGNIYGGRSADKDPSPDRLYRRIVIAALWIAAIPVLGKYLIIGIAGVIIFAVNTNFLVIAAFAACMIIFVYPLFLLGTVTPSLAKYTMDSLEDNASIVGRLGAFNTIGSIIGTFVPTFVSIPAVGTSVTFLIFAGILLVLALIYFIGRGRTKAVMTGLIFVICVVFGHNTAFAFWQDDLTVEDESIYNYLQVYETGNRVVLSTNVLFGVQSVYLREEGLTGLYYDYAMAAPVMAGYEEKDAPMKVLILGMGTGTYATQCNRYFGDMDITGVEIDQKITDLAHEYFELDDGIEVITYDGRAYLNAIDGTYDVIMVDAYQDITIPFQMSSVEFFSMVRDHLNPGGVMVVNMNMRGQSEGSINNYLADTIASVFDQVYTVDVAGSTNRELFASNDAGMVDRLRDYAGSSVVQSGGSDEAVLREEELISMMGYVCSQLEEYKAGDLIMTDDKAPVELLGMRVIDEIIGDEVAQYKSIYRERGIGGLLEIL
ncbi:MAG: fused MFS/spermidine synthase [Lachnospiraceae bacterium]|nr:fused MFS/spermidine synthase [Lachnospiraceae bacterium]